MISAPNMGPLRKNSSCVQIFSNINTTLMYTVASFQSLIIAVQNDDQLLIYFSTEQNVFLWLVPILGTVLLIWASCGYNMGTVCK